MPQAAALDEHDRLPGLAMREADVREGRLMAELVTHFLESISLLPPASRRRKRPVVDLPREFLLELGLILRVHAWERAGLRDRIGPDLPTSRRALADLFVRFGLDRRPPVDATADVRLTMGMFVIALDRLAWAGREELDADVALDAPADERWLEALADFLWENRRAGRSGGDTT